MTQRELLSLFAAVVAVDTVTMAKPNGDMMVGVVFDKKVTVDH